jgi:hypothetical protein
MIAVWILGLLAVFFVGYFATASVLVAIVKAKRKPATQMKRMDGTPVEWQSVGWEGKIKDFAVVGGFVTVALMVLLRFGVPLRWAVVIWIVMLVIGFVLVQIFDERG